MQPTVRIAVGEIMTFLLKNDLPEKVFLVCFAREAYQQHFAALKELMPVS